MSAWEAFQREQDALLEAEAAERERVAREAEEKKKAEEEEAKKWEGKSAMRRRKMKASLAYEEQRAAKAYEQQMAEQRAEEERLKREKMIAEMERQRREAEEAARELERKTKIYLDGSRYVGDYKEGNPARIPHGYGEFRRADGSTQYDGNWRDGMMHGEGTYTWPNDDIWEGMFWKDDLHGLGTYTFDDKKITPKVRKCYYWQSKRVCWFDELQNSRISVEVIRDSWHQGTVTNFNEKTGKHFVEFDLKKSRWVDLSIVHFKVLFESGQFEMLPNNPAQ